MAVPKRRMSRSNTRHRRARWRASAPALVPVTVDGATHLVPQHLRRAYERGLLRPEG
ncbi:50S ribosomal protein L32 [Streptomyces sp. LaBMicrA B280]|uniref:50S ribosomal protein L32 n=1 Tax=Streptomyces sp. LaBMicrA B280 TaxID=3391001 RepID=UPI003BA5A117